MNKAMKGSEIREAFLKFFESKGHTIVPSSSLVPYNDATLLFTNAGMVQFKDVFLGVEKKPFTRATSAQRCLRAGGKHNDLDTVGRTARHHTFFEMLGNFSFGDYFKRDAISYAWEFLTEVLALPKEKLYVTVYEKDDEAYELWHDLTGIPYEKIYRIGAKDNFWAMGETGPCGPCSEIFFDRGEKYGCDAEVCGIGSCDCDRWMEIWNLVFMQYNRDEEGNLTPLPRPSIDTGMGLERITSIMQEVDSNYDTDLIHSLIHEVEKLCGKEYSKGPEGFPFRVVADHARSCSFMICDGIMPSNEGRGYVLRRILRRACRLGRTLGLTEPFLYKLVPAVQQTLGKQAPDLLEKTAMVQNIIKLEEERFNITLTDGLAVADQIVKAVKAAGGDTISGEDAFRLYDTYGFPLDLTKDIADEQGLKIDEVGFDAAMQEQRRRSKESRKEGAAWNQTVNLLSLLEGVPATKFLGYTECESDAEVLAVICEGKLCDKVYPGDEGYIVLDRTPFYAEGGGQLGDKGVIRTAEGELVIIDCKKLPGGIFLHSFTVPDGAAAAKGEKVKAVLDMEKRMDMARNHSCTHLLQKALRDRLGDHLHQAGSYVGEDRLRFDFTHFAPMTSEELQAVEAAVNAAILADLPISCLEMPVDEAKKSGAMAIFGEKYGDVVRVVSMGDYSKELCGGTHCKATGQIGSFKILSEAGIGAGQRRIEAVTGRAALAYYKAQGALVNETAAILKTNEDGLLKKAEALMQENRALQKELEKLKNAASQGGIEQLLNEAPEKQGVSIICGKVAADDMNMLRQTVDKLRDKKPCSVIALCAPTADKVNIAVACSQEAIALGLNAGKLAKEFAGICGGSGGGRPDMAQAGGKDPAKADEAAAKVKEMILSAL